MNPARGLSLWKTLQDSSATPIALLETTVDGAGVTKNWTSPQATLLAEWEPFSGIWPKWGLCARGECYELPTWGPAMAGHASSFWPTGRAEDSESTGAHRGVADTLTSAVEMWRSPDAPKAGGSRTHTTSSGNGHQLTIADQAEQWQTPSPPSQGGRTVKSGQVHLDEQAAFWQTPGADSFRSRGGDRKEEMGLGDPGGGGEFAEQAALWNPPCSLPVQQTRSGLEFWPRTRILLRLCRLLRRRLPSPYNKARSIFKRKLNPDFTDWLMGLPVGWSSEDRVFSAEEMAWYRCRLASCLRGLLGD